MVAKSFQNLEIVKEPYEVNGKMFVQVRTQAGTVRTVRWYSEEEYVKYNSASTSAPKTYGGRARFASNKTEKDALRFSQCGYLTIFRGDTYSCKDWFKEHGARYNKAWGWAFPGDAPADLPEGVEPVRLDWEKVGNEDGSLKLESEVKEAVDALIYEPDGSEHVGNVGDRVEVRVVVEKAIQLDGYYSPSTMHLMRGLDDDNVYVWTTASKSWAEGTAKTIRGTIKDHKTYRGTKQTVLTRCTEVKEGK